MTKAAPAKKPVPPNNQAKTSEQADSKPQTKPGRVISDPREVAQLVMMRIDQVNTKKDELTIAAKALADTAKQLVNAYTNQQTQIAKLTKRVEELEKQNIKT